MRSFDAPAAVMLRWEKRPEFYDGGRATTGGHVWRLTNALGIDSHTVEIRREWGTWFVYVDGRRVGRDVRRWDVGDSPDFSVAGEQVLRHFVLT